MCAFRHAKNRLRRYVKYGITEELVIRVVESEVAAGGQGSGLALLPTSIGDFRVAFVVEERATTIKTIMPPRQSVL